MAIALAIAPVTQGTCVTLGIEELFYKVKSFLFREIISF